MKILELSSPSVSNTPYFLVHSMYMNWTCCTTYKLILAGLMVIAYMLVFFICIGTTMDPNIEERRRRYIYQQIHFPLEFELFIYAELTRFLEHIELSLVLRL